MNELENECLELETNNPIRKIILYKSAKPMYYELNKVMALGKVIISSIEYANGKYYVFVNQILANGDSDDVTLLWKVETSPEISVEYDLEFMRL